MIEEQGRVVAIEHGAVWVEASSKTTCSGCTASASCGRGLLEWLGAGRRSRHIRALSVIPLQVGDSVVVGIREDFLLRSAFSVYLLPLLALFICAIAIQQLGFGESAVILAGLLGFAFAWGMVRRASRRQMNDPALQPVVLRALPGISEGQAGRAAF
ncbi:SoxR reducing system RseC family protein [Azotobacter salinestris]|uniref:SoxR reducing system RseC family protein n=1 Tax=Azotobacter salinestris TaxID=69964 RepID=UPI001266D6F1|nr:SoxR reducing system RseC family protein [Azotobacter salinestris]